MVSREAESGTLQRTWKGEGDPHTHPCMSVSIMSHGPLLFPETLTQSLAGSREARGPKFCVP